jgi:hypothetical protein
MIVEHMFDCKGLIPPESLSPNPSIYDGNAEGVPVVYPERTELSR